MNVFAKILLGIAGVLLALAIAATLAVTVLFDPKDYQPLLARSVEQATGRRLTLSGDLGLDLFPCCSITLGRTALGNPPGFPPGDFASVGSASLSLKLWPLIRSREVQIGTVRLTDLNADLLVRNDGASNWSFEGGEAAAGGAPAGGAGTKPERLFIEGIEIDGGRISYRDEQDPASYLAEDLQLSTGHLEPGEPFDLKVASTLTDQSDGTAGRVALESTATVDEGFTRITLANPSFDISAGGGVVPAKSLVMKLGAAELGIENEQATRFRFKGLEGEFTLEALEALAGDAEGSFVADDARLELGPASSLQVPALAADITVSGEKTPGGSVNSVIRLGGVAVDLDKMLAGIESLSADITGLGGRMALTGSGRVADTGADLAGTVKIEPLSPRNVLAILKAPEPKTADPKALTRLAGQSSWKLGPDSLALDGMDLSLDDSKVTGKLAVRDFDKPATTFDLRLDAIDLDRYLEPDAPAAPSPSPVGAAPAATNSPKPDDIPIETLRDLRLDGRLQVGQFKLADVRLSNLDARVKAADGRLRVEPLQGKLYGGELAGTMSVDASGAKARIAMDQQLAAVQVGQALKELFQNDKLTGALTGRINARGTGNTSDELLRTLAGNVALSLADGAYLGSDLWYEIRAARARLRGDPVPAPPASPRTPFNALEIAGTLTDGVLASDKLYAEIPFIRMKGTGTLNLVSKAMDYKLQAEVFEAPVFEDGSDLKDLAGLTIAMNLTGPMDSPKVSVDLKNLAAGVATQKLKNRLIKKLGLDKPEEGAAPAEPAAGDAQPATEPPAEEKPRDALKRTLRDLLKPPP